MARAWPSWVRSRLRFLRHPISSGQSPKRSPRMLRSSNDHYQMFWEVAAAPFVLDKTRAGCFKRLHGDAWLKEETAVSRESRQRVSRRVSTIQ